MHDSGRNRLALGMVTVAVAIAMACGGSSSTPEEKPPVEASMQKAGPVTPVLAKAHLAEAAAEGKKWKPDAMLVQIYGRNVKDDGTAPSWDYNAYSPSAKSCLGINFIRGNVSTRETRAEACQFAALGEIIDSDQAMKIARENGVSRESISMLALPSPTRPGTSLWQVVEEGMRNPGNMTVDIDAATGKVLNTTKNP